MRLTTACFSIWEGSARRCTAVGWAASSWVGGIWMPSSKVSGNMAARTRWARVMAYPSMSESVRYVDHESTYLPIRDICQSSLIKKNISCTWGLWSEWLVELPVVESRIILFSIRVSLATQRWCCGGDSRLNAWIQVGLLLPLAHCSLTVPHRHVQLH